MHEFYATHSPISDPGKYAHLFDGLPQDIGGISKITQGLVYHYFGDEQFFGFHPPQERLPEIDTRYMERMLARILEMDDRPLSEARDYDKRLIGCCRDFSLLACAILRHQGRAARLRYGFADYFIPDHWMDHVVVEVWEAGRWQRFDPEIPADGPWNFNSLDMPAAPFATGGRAWQMVRHEGADASRFGLGPNVPDVSGIPFVRGRLQLDIAALNKQEMLCWDDWENEDDVLLDKAAALTLEVDSTALRSFYAAQPTLHLPDTVTCYSPAVGPHPFKTVAA